MRPELVNGSYWRRGGRKEVNILASGMSLAVKRADGKGLRCRAIVLGPSITIGCTVADPSMAV
jgi:hypothetical protein